MPGSILFIGICAVVYFVVGIRFGHDVMPDGCTLVGEFSVLTLIFILSVLLLNAYCQKKESIKYNVSSNLRYDYLLCYCKFCTTILYPN